MGFLVFVGVPPHPEALLSVFSQVVTVRENNKAQNGEHCDEDKNHTAPANRLGVICLPKLNLLCVLGQVRISADVVIGIMSGDL